MKKKFLIGLVIVAAAVAGWYGWQHQSPDRGDSPQGQLPDTIKPTAYQIDLTVDPAKDNFTGQVVIAAELTAPADRIWLHGERLQMQSATVVLASGETLTADYQEVGETGVAELRFGQTVAPQTLSLQFAYAAPFDRTLNGLYLVEDGGERYAFTQMESHFARKAIPSFDEPRFKVPFTVSLTVRNEHEAIANTPTVKVEPIGTEFKKIQFAPSKPLPTYLLAWAVGRLDVVEWQPIPASAVRSQAIPLRGIATHGKGGQLKYALQHTAGILQTLEDYFGIAYPYEKLDILAVPDFEAGAMENAGAITYREQLLLLDESASLQQQRAYVSVHAHELAHQWFGNLVTMPWWNDIWLNEAFASWMENKAVNRFAPAMGFELANHQDAQGAMGLDALASMREIRQPILDNADISNAFDGITYSKGAAVIAMFENYVGEEVFRRGVTAYLNRYAWGNATAEQFVAAIAEAAGDERINPAFFSFLTQVGVPEIQLSGHCQDGVVQATVKQSRYLPLGSAAARDLRWQVPVCLSAYGAFGQQKQCTLLTEAEQTWQFQLPSCPTHVMPNANGAGYYRFSLAPDEQSRLLQALPSLPLTEAYVLADNLNAALRAGRIDVNAYLAAVPTLAAHPSRHVALLPLGTLEFIRDYLVSSADRPVLERFYSALYQPRLAAIGLTPKADDNAEVRLQRTALVGFLSDVARHPELRSALRDWGKAYVGFAGDNSLHPEAVPADLVRPALVVAQQELGAPFFEALSAQLEKSEDGTVRGYLIGAMASADDPALAAEARERITSLDLRTNERMQIAYTQMDNPATADALFQWFKGKYKVLRPLLPEGVQKRMPMLGMRYCTPEKAAEVQAYFQPLMAELPGGERSLNNTLETITLCHAFVTAQPAIQWEPLAPAQPAN